MPNTTIAPFLADTLKAYRWRAQLSVKQLARRANMAVYHLESIENAKQKAGLETVINLSYALGVNPAEIVSDVIKRIRRHPDIDNLHPNLKMYI